MIDGVSAKAVTVTGGLLAGIIFGAVAQRTHFCTMGAISDWVIMGDSRRFRAWMLALAIGLLGTQALWGLGVVDLDTAIYRTSNFGWLGAIVGGLMFGFGMVQAGGCGNKTLVRLGAGNLKSLVVFLVLAITAYMTLRGLFGPVRSWLEGAANITLPVSQGIDALLGRLVGLPPDSLRVAFSLVIGVGAMIWCLKDQAFRKSGRQLVSGIIIGLLIPLGWFITGNLGQDEFDPIVPASFTFIAPSADTLQYAMTFTGSTINFGIAIVLGVIAGSFLMSMATGTFRVEAFAGPKDMIGSMGGAALMGCGGVLAMGCTIGQGLSGVSTLALGSCLALGAIIVGGYYGVRYLEEGSHRAALRLLLSRT